MLLQLLCFIAIYGFLLLLASCYFTPTPDQRMTSSLLMTESSPSITQHHTDRVDFKYIQCPLTSQLRPVVRVVHYREHDCKTSLSEKSIVTLLQRRRVVVVETQLASSYDARIREPARLIGNCDDTDIGACAARGHYYQIYQECRSA